MNTYEVTTLFRELAACHADACSNPDPVHVAGVGYAIGWLHTALKYDPTMCHTTESRQALEQAFKRWERTLKE